MRSSSSPFILVIALGMALFITVMVRQATLPRIQASQKAEFIKVIDELMRPSDGDAIEFDNDPQTDVVSAFSNLLNVHGATRIYRFRKNTKPVAVLIESVAPDGYNGNINLLVAIASTGEILGVRATEHHETPGLGDDIDIRRSQWIKQFDNLSLLALTESDWHVAKDGGQFDQFTGATITPRAVVRAVHNTLLWYAQEQEQLFSLPTNSLLE